MQEKNTNSETKEKFNKFLEIQCNKANEIKSKRNIVYYSMFIVLNILVLVLLWFYLSSKHGNEKISNIIECFNWNYLYLIIAISVISLFLVSILDFIFIYTRNRQRGFWSCLCGNAKKDFFNLVTFYNGGYSVFAQRLSQGNIDTKVCIDQTYSKKIFSKISLIIYSFVALLIGSILKFKSCNVLFFILGVISFIVIASFVMFILYFDKQKKNYVVLVGGLCKFLYKIKLIKNYEKLYKNILDKLVMYNSALKSKKVMSIIYIVLSIINLFIKQMIIFIILRALNYADISNVVEIIYKATLLELIVAFLPLQKGAITYSIIFVLLFSSTFFEGYVFWAVAIYRIFTYTLKINLFLISQCVDKVVQNLINKRRNKEKGTSDV